MRLPWFMHMHAGTNTMTGLMPTPVGTFVRSCAASRMEVAWYPLDGSFPGGASREVKRLATVDSTDHGERQLEQAVIDFMHGHPALALIGRYDGPSGPKLAWDEVGGGALATHEDACGLFFRIHHGGTVTLEYLPKGGIGRRETVGVFADTCDEDTLGKRIDAAVGRRVAQADEAAARRDGGGA